MNKTRLLLPVLISLAATTAVQAQFEYTTNDGAITITGYSGSGGQVIIPTNISSLPVTAIGANAFESSSLSGVTIPDSITSIGAGAFEFCTGLGSVTIPGSVTEIGEDAFNECISLTNAVLGEGVPSIGYGMFEACGSLTSVNIPNSVSSIAGLAFESDAGLGSITIPGRVTSIGGLAFEQCYSLTNIFFKGNPPTFVSTAFTDDENVTVYYLLGATNWNTNFANFPTVLWNPQIVNGGTSFGVSNNQFGFNITGASNIPIVVEAGDDLSGANWTPL
ncbi:MAG TPA: leucine-rich repeat domain-containing protein, partial [Verrucomicrobiae bacterium]|nr:leucine-rich repeat domain-containing protein [Verrucomicrobiae bacterium]